MYVLDVSDKCWRNENEESLLNFCKGKFKHD